MVFKDANSRRDARGGKGMTSVEPFGAGTQPEAGALGHRGGQPKHDVFVSYSSQDKPVADAIVSRFEHTGIRCWVAPRDVLPGAVWAEAIINAIETTRLMVVVLSGESNESTHVNREVGRAVSKNVIVIPFRIEAVEPTGAMAYYLADEHWLDAMTPPLDAHIARLMDVAQVLLQTAPAPHSQQPAQAVPVPPTSPPATPGRRPVGTVGLVAAAVAALGVLALLAWSLFATPAPEEPVVEADEPGVEAEGPLTEAGHTAVFLEDLTQGDCVLTPAAHAADPLDFWQGAGFFPPTMRTVPCDAPHGGEVFFAGNAWEADEDFPGPAALEASYFDICDSEFTAYTGTVVDEQRELDYTGIYPDYLTWNQGDRLIVCIAFRATGEQLESSIGR